MNTTEAALKDPFHISKLIALTKFWRECPIEACRRHRCCTDHARCEREYWHVVRWFKRKYVLPHLRERFPSVQWGAPAGVVELQLEAALVAEKATGAGAPAAREAAVAGRRDAAPPTIAVMAATDRASPAPRARPAASPRTTASRPRSRRG